MAGRIRTVKPEWLEDEHIIGLDVASRLLTVALLLLADDHGRGRASAAYIGASVFANEPDPRATASRTLAELSRIGFVDLYTVRGQSYFAIRNWAKHQRVDKPGTPRVPPPDEAETPRDSTIRETLAKVPETFARSQEILATDLRSPTSDLDLRGGADSRPALTPSPIPALKPDAAAVRSELAKADDLWPADGLDRVAKRIADTVTDPLNRAKGEHVHVTREAIAHARTEKGKHPHATPETLLGKAEQKVGWILADYRTGKRRKDGTGPGIAPNDLDFVPLADEIAAAKGTISTRIDPEPPPLTAEERQKRIAQLAARVGRGAA